MPYPFSTGCSCVADAPSKPLLIIFDTFVSSHVSERLYPCYYRKYYLTLTYKEFLPEDEGVLLKGSFKLVRRVNCDDTMLRVLFVAIAFTAERARGGGIDPHVGERVRGRCTNYHA